MNDIEFLSYLTPKPISTKKLCDHFHVDRRQLQKAREALEEEYPILSSQEGYWVAGGVGEYSEVLARDRKELEASARRYSKRRKAMRRYFPEFQPTLFQIDEVA